jgi:hypothetical protein
MEKITISHTYNVKHWLSNDVCLTSCNKVINVKLGKELKPILRGSKKCYYISGKFESELKPFKKDINCPF